MYRQQFYALRQCDGESVTNFVSRLKAQAMLCAFTCPSQECTTSHSSDMIKSQLIAGIRNPSHQDKVLSEMEILKTLDQVTNRLLALESTERAATHFRPPFSPALDNTITSIGHDKCKPSSTPKNTFTNTKKMLWMWQGFASERSNLLSCLGKDLQQVQEAESLRKRLQRICQCIH